MQRTTSTNNVGSLPTYASGGETPGYYTDLVSGGPGTAATLVGAADLNLIQEEIANAVTTGGLSLDGTNSAQMASALGGAYAAKSHATDTGAVSTVRLRGVFASGSAQASGAASAVIGTAGGIASGNGSAVIGSVDIAGSPPQASGAGSVVAASANSFASGTTSAVVGSVASTASGGSTIVAASTSSLASGTASAVIACDDCDAIGDGAAVIASTGSYASGAGSVCIGGQNVEVHTPGMVGGGDNSAASAISGIGVSNQGLTWKITGEGRPHFTLKDGADQSDAAAVAGELWRTNGHATLPDGVVMVGI